MKKIWKSIGLVILLLSSASPVYASFRIPTFLDIISLSIFNIVPGLFLIGLFVKIILIKFVKDLKAKRHKLNFLASFSIPFILYITYSSIWLINDFNSIMADLLTLGNMLKTNLLILIAVSILAFSVFILMELLDKILTLETRKRIIVLIFLIILFAFIYPKIIFNVTNTPTGAETTKCQCMGIKTRNNEVCHGIKYNCSSVTKPGLFYMENL